jgi:hypothetical protein
MVLAQETKHSQPANQHSQPANRYGKKRACLADTIDLISFVEIQIHYRSLIQPSDESEEVVSYRIDWMKPRVRG